MGLAIAFLAFCALLLLNRPVVSLIAFLASSSVFSALIARYLPAETPLLLSYALLMASMVPLWLRVARGSSRGRGAAGLKTPSVLLWMLSGTVLLVGIQQGTPFQQAIPEFLYFAPLFVALEQLDEREDRAFVKGLVLLGVSIAVLNLVIGRTSNATLYDYFVPSSDASSTTEIGESRLLVPGIWGIASTSLTYLLWMILERLVPWGRKAWIGIGALLVVLAGMSYGVTRSQFLGFGLQCLFIVLAGLLVLDLPRIRAFSLMVGILTATAVVYLTLNSQLAANWQYRLKSSDQDSLTVRLEASEYVLGEMSRSPLSADPDLPDPLTRTSGDAHGLLIIWWRFGLPGLALFVAIEAWVVAVLLRAYRKSRSLSTESAIAAVVLGAYFLRMQLGQFSGFYPSPQALLLLMFFLHQVRRLSTSVGKARGSRIMRVSVATSV